MRQTRAGNPGQNSVVRRILLVPVVVLLLAGLCFAAPTIRLSPNSGPPTSNLQVSGSGFSAYAAIDIYFDTTDEALAIANGRGAFSNISIPVPASALPGNHYVSAVQRSNGLGAQALFVVQTNWAELGFTSKNNRRNPYENVLSPSTVGLMDLQWSFTTAGAVSSSPAVANGVVYVGSLDYHVHALKARTGAELWSFPTGG
jgi:hypothetical protein